MLDFLLKKKKNIGSDVKTDSKYSLPSDDQIKVTALLLRIEQLERTLKKHVIQTDLKIKKLSEQVKSLIDEK